MVTLFTKKRDFKFNLKTTGFRGEIALCQTITRLLSEGYKPRSKINISTDDGNLLIKISDITDMKFSESEYVKSKVHIK
jgi:hypothetical protein